jgi:hypothetical protein
MQMAHFSHFFLISLTLITSAVAQANPKPALAPREKLVSRIEKACNKVLANPDADAPVLAHPEKICSCESSNLDHKLSHEELDLFTRALENSQHASEELQKEKYAEMLIYADLVERSCQNDFNWAYDPQKQEPEEDQ